MKLVFARFFKHIVIAVIDTAYGIHKALIYRQTHIANHHRIMDMVVLRLDPDFNMLKVTKPPRKDQTEHFKEAALTPRQYLFSQYHSSMLNDNLEFQKIAFNKRKYGNNIWGKLLLK